MTGGGPSPQIVEVPGAGAPAQERMLPADLCDEVLGEIGRREHRFSWLRMPGCEDWLAVDAYYPANRVVVVSHLTPEQTRICRELVPRQGLCLIVAPDVLAGAHAQLLAGLRQALERSGWTPQARPRPAVPPPAMAAPAVASPSGAVAVRRGSGPAERFGMLIALVLIAIVWAEAYLGVIVVALGHGQVALGSGIVLDGCARVLGTVAAGYAGRADAAWSCLLVGCPQVAAFAYTEREGGRSSEPAQLAGLVAVAAMVVLVAGVVLLVT
jgi:hypothetical protein